MSAIREEGPDGAEPIQVLVTLHNQMSLLDVAGVLQVLSAALHDTTNPGMLSINIRLSSCTKIVRIQSI